MYANVNQKKIQIIQNEKKNLPKTAQNEEKEIELISEKEKIYLQGEPHIETTPSDKDIIYPQLEEKLETEPKKEKIFRPRENYLKEKMIKLNYDEKLLTKIKKDLGTQVEDLKNQIENKNIIITEVPKDLNKLIVRSSSTQNKIVKYSNEDYETKKKHKILKDLREEQISLKRRLNKIEENESLLNKEGFMNLNNTSECLTKFDKSIKEQQMNTVKNKKNDINERLKEIDFRINKLLEEENFKLTKNEKIKSFKENFERDKEIIEERARKYLKETKERNKRLAKDIDQLAEKRRKEIEKKVKEDELKKEKLRKDFIEKEKAIEQERRKEKTKKILIYKPYINQKFEKTENDYLFGIYDKKYHEKEQKLLDKVNYDLKIRNKSLTNEELQNFRVKIDEKKKN